jgi:hypothetical protein
MLAKPSSALFCALLFSAAAAIGAAFAEQPQAARQAAAPRAADQTLGMAIMSANVDRSGTLTGGAGVVGALRQANGQYFVAFNRSVEGCTHVGAVAGDVAFVFPGLVAATPKTDTFNGRTYYGVRVDTSDHDAFITDRPFHLIVFCSR